MALDNINKSTGFNNAYTQQTQTTRIGLSPNFTYKQDSFIACSVSTASTTAVYAGAPINQSQISGEQSTVVIATTGVPMGFAYDIGGGSMSESSQPPVMGGGQYLALARLGSGIEMILPTDGTLLVSTTAVYISYPASPALPFLTATVGTNVLIPVQVMEIYSGGQSITRDVDGSFIYQLNVPMARILL